MTNKKWSAWKPYPAGVYTAVIFGSLAIVYLICGVLFDHSWWCLVSVGPGAIAIFETANAGFHAGLRTESHAKELLRRRNDQY